MQNTYIPLDMIFIAPDGRIVYIAEPTPSRSRRPPSRPRRPVRGVLEINGGAAESWASGRRPGDSTRSSEIASRLAVAAQPARGKEAPRRPVRGVAQPGSASALGAEGRRFESCRPDQLGWNLATAFPKNKFRLPRPCAGDPYTRRPPALTCAVGARPWAPGTRPGKR